MAIRKGFEEMQAVPAGSAGEAAPNAESPNWSEAGSGGNRNDNAAGAGLSLRAARPALEPVAEPVCEPGVRVDKVALVRAGLAAGRYNVPAWAVASKMSRLGWAARRGCDPLWIEAPLSSEVMPTGSDLETALAVRHDLERLRELRANRLDCPGWPTWNWIPAQGKYGYN